MRYVALACDYDGTLALDGRVDERTVEALERAAASGRKLVLVTGRELDDLLRVFPRVDLFDRVVAENGALLYQPATREERQLGEPPPAALVAALRERGVTPLSVGRVIVATWHPHETTVLDAIRDLGLERQVIFNKGAVMVLPPGVNKATGLVAALDELGLSPHNTVAVGDAENDHAFLDVSECAVAVANALPMVKERADYVTRADHGAGVVELIEQLLADDLRGLEPSLQRRRVLLGTRDDGTPLCLPPYGLSVLFSGPSGSGKSTAASGMVERLAEQGYQFCLIDPEGDYEAFGGAVSLGDSQRPPGLDEVLQLLREPARNAVVNLLGVPLADRPTFFAALFPRLQALRAETGRPHWIVVDEAHHVLPARWDPATLMLPQALGELILITLYPAHLAPALLAAVDVAVAVGASPERTLGELAQAVGQPLPPGAPTTLGSQEALVWCRGSAEPPIRIRVEPAHAERRRHRRKYAAGELGPDLSFYFRGPDGKLNLRAQNLILFLQLGEGVDDATWLHHLRQGDYSRWFREAIKDDALAAATAEVEQQPDLDARESRARIRAAIERRYTLPA